MMFIEASVGQVYFYILCKWVTICFSVFFIARVAEEILVTIRARYINAGPCKACKNLEERIKRLESKGV